jgi:hypothetical protein
MSLDFLERTEIIEECYEFMLAYVAEGLLLYRPGFNHNGGKRPQ